MSDSERRRFFSAGFITGWVLVTFAMLAAGLTVSTLSDEPAVEAVGVILATVGGIMLGVPLNAIFGHFVPQAFEDEIRRTVKKAIEEAAKDVTASTFHRRPWWSFLLAPFLFVVTVVQAPLRWWRAWKRSPAIVRSGFANWSVLVTGLLAFGAAVAVSVAR